MKRIFLPLLLLIFILFSAPQVNADGFNIYMDRSFFALHGENTQIAAINYENGVEKLLLAVKTEQLQDDSVVWIVPVAANASEVKINIFRDFPHFSGSDIVMVDRDRMSYGFSLAYGASVTQIYPAFLVMYGSFFGGQFRGIGYGAGDVEIYATVEKEGITTQVIKADTAIGLYNYLNGKNITISQGSIPILEEYIGEDYSFVVSWVRAIAGNESHRTPSIFVEFPTDKIYYPLKPTSLYGDRGIPILLYVVGLAEPELYDGIKNYTLVRYFQGSIFERWGERGWLKEFYPNATDIGAGQYRAHAIYYTTIMIGNEDDWIIPSVYQKPETPSADIFTEDLWIKHDSPPHDVEQALARNEVFSYMRENPTMSWAIIIIWIALASMISSWLAGLLMFKGYGFKTALLGLANLLTLVIFIIATFGFFKKEEINRPKFIVAFTIIFLIINFVIFAPLFTFFLF
ncbi:MAG: hypothetical protein JSW41_04545 [Candidatus Aenigmatarchaeota archaeon]|nr:MAG: hypothetical protein JSW41_04545 [Candidatus Aenigmarchaeota archaeon]